jgi:predicted protein tyrosine phosphatase
MFLMKATRMPSASQSSCTTTPTASVGTIAYAYRSVPSSEYVTATYRSVKAASGGPSDGSATPVPRKAAAASAFVTVSRRTQPRARRSARDRGS